MINEIDELAAACDLLFGEQRRQNDQQDRVKFKAQEQSLNPCYFNNQNSHSLKQGENYYFFQLNELYQFVTVDDNKRQSLNQLLDRISLYED